MGCCVMSKMLEWVSGWILELGILLRTMRFHADMRICSCGFPNMRIYFQYAHDLHIDICGLCGYALVFSTIAYVCAYTNKSKHLYCRGERIVFWWPNTNTNIIRLSKTDRIRIRILFGLPKMTEYEYEDYSGFQICPKTNTNIIRLPKNDSLKTQIIFFVLAQQCNIRGAFIHFSFWALQPVKAHYCSQRQSIKEYKRTIYFQKVQTGCICYKCCGVDDKILTKSESQS